MTPSESVEGEPGGGGCCDEWRLGNLDLLLQQEEKCDDADRRGQPAVDRVSPDYDRRSRDCAGRGCSFDESLQAWVVLEAAEQAARNDDEHIGGGEEGDGRYDCAGDASDQVPGEGAHDHNRAGADQPYRDRVGQLAFGQPVVVCDKALV